MKTKSKLTQNSLTPEQEEKLFRLFASWSKRRKYEYIKKLPKERAFRLKYTWRAWARDSQLAPAGDWSTWVLMSGRGFGKTRTGAEWVVEKAEAYPGCHIALVGRTVADVRDVMIQGRSGVLAVSPPWFMPVYKPSLRTLVWPNGSYATTYSADVPDQLRGPQHSFAWCLAGETPVLMADESQKALADIRVGDYVMTRKGPRRVTWQGMTKRNSEVYLLKTLGRQTIIGTAEHPVWVQGRGFVPISQLSKGMSVLCVTPALNSVGMCGISEPTETTMSDVSCFTDLCGSKLMVQSQRDTIFTTKTVIKQITDSKTLNCLHMESTVEDMLKKNWDLTEKYPWQMQLPQESATAKSVWRKPFTAHGAEVSTIAPHLTQRVFAQVPALKLHGQERLLAKPDCVSFAVSNIKQRNAINITAQKNAMIVPLSNAHHLKFAPLNVQSAISTLKQNDQTHVSAHGHVPLLITDEIASVEKFPTLIDVYDITVEDAHEFFAGDILVHNCDEKAAWQYEDSWTQLQFGLRIEPALGVIPQAVVTTTPRNTKAMKDLIKDPSTVVTKRSTYENRENLSEKFIREIERHFAGTRLGRQEIEGEIIDDIDGALWKREWIERNRVIKHPELKRIVVAVDPPASSAETSDDPAEAGIVVSGLGVDGHGYMLADYSMVGTPDEWASAALTAYNIFEADCIVGEINNGGDMIAAVIHSKAKEQDMKCVNFKSVRATRGKQLRAEPISSLYQRDLIHHVGVFPNTEDQMCNWVPGQKSPDRLDANVWSFTELMVSNEPTPEELIADAKRRVEIAAQRKLAPTQGLLPTQGTIPSQQKKKGWWDKQSSTPCMKCRGLSLTPKS